MGLWGSGVRISPPRPVHSRKVSHARSWLTFFAIQLSHDAQQSLGQEREILSSKSTNLIMRNSIFAWIAAATVVLLSIPLIAMQFTEQVNWGSEDFVAMGLLLLGTGCLFVLVSRKTPRKYWLAIGLVSATLFLYAWAELAVGIFTNLGS